MMIRRAILSSARHSSGRKRATEACTGKKFGSHAAPACTVAADYNTTPSSSSSFSRSFASNQRSATPTTGGPPTPPPPLSDLALNLLSYETLHEALMDRGETNRTRFSQLLLADVVGVVDQLDGPQLAALIDTLIIPQPEMTVPSHCLPGVLDLLVKFTKKYSDDSSTPSHFTLNDCVMARGILSKVVSINIYHTTEYSDNIAKKQSSTLKFSLNRILHMFSILSQQMRSPEASRDVVQQAEHLLMEFGGVPTIKPERLHLSPDIVSFNTVITAWARSNSKQQREKKQRHTSKQAYAAAKRTEAKHANITAERAQGTNGLCGV